MTIQDLKTILEAEVIFGDELMDQKSTLPAGLI